MPNYLPYLLCAYSLRCPHRYSLFRFPFPFARVPLLDLALSLTCTVRPCPSQHLRFACGWNCLRHRMCRYSIAPNTPPESHLSDSRRLPWLTLNLRLLSFCQLRLGQVVVCHTTNCRIDLTCSMTSPVHYSLSLFRNCCGCTSCGSSAGTTLEVIALSLLIQVP